MFQAKVLAILEKDAMDQWNDPWPLTLAGRPFQPTDQNTKFIRHSIVFGDGMSKALGGGYYRYMALQYLSIFYQTGEGLQSLYATADRMMAYYTEKLINDVDTGVKIVFQVASTIALPKDATGFNQLQVVCPFYFDTRS